MAPRTRKSVSVICVDVDGTLCDSTHQLPAANAAALSEAMARGVRVVLATGKMPGAWLPPLMGALGYPSDAVALNAPSVTLNGLLVTNQDGTIASQQLMRRGAVQRALQVRSDHPRLTQIVFSTDGLLAEELDEWTEFAKQFQEPATKAIGKVAMEALASDGVGTRSNPGVFKITFWGKEEDITEAQPAIVTALESECAVTRSLSTLIEVLPRGCGKSEGVKTALSILGAELSEVLALGDGENDAEMLKMVKEGGGVSVAMANGMELTKAAASEVGLTNDESGVADAVARFVFGHPGNLEGIGVVKSSPKQRRKPAAAL